MFALVWVVARSACRRVTGDLHERQHTDLPGDLLGDLRVQLWQRRLWRRVRHPAFRPCLFRALRLLGPLVDAAAFSPCALTFNHARRLSFTQLRLRGARRSSFIRRPRVRRISDPRAVSTRHQPQARVNA